MADPVGLDLVVIHLVGRGRVVQDCQTLILADKKVFIVLTIISRIIECFAVSRND